MSSNNPRKSHHLQHLTTTFHHNNKSFSSIASNTNSEMTFHSAHDHTQMEMRPMSQPSAVTRSISRPISPVKTDTMSSPKIGSMKMDRQDSGYSDTIHASPRTSTSSRRSSPSKDIRSSNPPTNPKPKRRTTNSSSHSSTKSSTRPSTKRASRSSPFPTSTLMQTRNSVSGSSRRPSMAARGHTHSASTPYHSSSQTYQFFHFPTFDPIASSHPPSGQAQEEMSELEVDTPRHHPPPATTQYWTSDSTRRLEYAAIDAAGKGVKGFLIRCVPDCILPVEKRRTRFCGENGIDEDCGSVRRYRLTLPEEKSLVEQCREQRPGFLRRWTTFGRRRDSC